MSEAQPSQGPGCSGGLEQQLNCRYDQRLARFFQWNQVPSLVLAASALALTGHITGIWWPLVALVAGAAALWGLGVETRVLCTHCPFYAQEGRTLRCLALDGWPKLWRYRPGPMSGWEKAVLVLFFLFLELLPVAAEAYSAWYIHTNRLGDGAFWGMVGIVLATAMAELQFLYVIRQDFCSRCVNFSCALNGVPRALVDAYLAHNRVMGEAWAKSGHR